MMESVEKGGIERVYLKRNEGNFTQTKEAALTKSLMVDVLRLLRAGRAAYNIFKR